jgi:hypothetical protein
MSGNTLNVSGTLTSGDKGAINVSGANLDNWQIRQNQVALDRLVQVPASNLLGRGSDATGNVTQITLGAGLTMTGTQLSAAAVTNGSKGDITVSTSGADQTWSINSGVVTYAKLQTVPTGTLLGRYSTTPNPGSVQGITLATSLTLNSSTGVLGIAANAITATELANNAVDADAIASGVVNNDKIAANAAIALSKIQTVTNQTLLGRSAAANGVPMEISMGSGLLLSNGSLSAHNIADSQISGGAAISLSKLQSIASGVILGRATTGSGTTEQLSLGSNLHLSGTTLNAAAGRNAIINGNFLIWQRGAGPYTASGVYTADRWRMERVGSSMSVERREISYASGNGPFGTSNPVNYCEISVTSVAGASNYAAFVQRIEDVRTFGGQQVTLSFTLGTDGSKPIGVELSQNFGSGGSATVSIPGGLVTISTATARYSVTFNVPTVSGKTIGSDSFLEVTFWLNAGSNFNARSSSLGQRSGIYNFINIQLELGPKASDFEERPYDDQVSLCERFFQRRRTAAQLTSYTRDLYLPTSMRKVPVVTVVNIGAGSGATYVADGQQFISQATNNSVGSGATVDCNAEL